MKKSICLILMATGVIFRAAAQETEEVRQEAEISVKEADELTSEEEKGGFTTEKDNRFFSVGLFSSADSLKTSVNLEFGFKLFKKDDFEMKSFTAIVGSKIYDDEPNLYELGLMQKFTFGGKDIYLDEISISRYGFMFGSFGFVSFDKNKQAKFLFDAPFYWEIGGGAGFNINVSRSVAIVMEFGGGMHMIGNGKTDYPSKVSKAGYGRMSLGGRYYFGNRSKKTEREEKDMAAVEDKSA